jgi:hypothetical protein
MEADQARAESLPPHVQLIQMGTAFWTSRVLYAAAKLSLPDHLARSSQLPWPQTAIDAARVRVRCYRYSDVCRCLDRLFPVTLDSSEKGVVFLVRGQSLAR